MDRYEALELYDLAISAAKVNGSLEEEALANELAAKFYLDWGKEKMAVGYMQAAYNCYAQWGAKAETERLKQDYFELLRPILQQTAINLGQTLATESSFPVNETLDLTSILRSAQILNENLELDRLLEQLGQIALQYFPVDRLILCLADNANVWQVRVIADSDNLDLVTESLDRGSNYPAKLINYVKNTQKTVAIDNLATDLPIIDDYLVEQQPRSILSLPLKSQKQTVGVLYLHSTSADFVLSPERIASLEFLCGQAAISLHNARLHEFVSLKSSVIESSLDGMAILEDGKFIYLNQSHIALYGYQANELIGKSWEQLYQPDELQRFQEVVFPIIGKSGKWSGEATALRKDGSTFPQELSLLLLEGDQLICICRDISDRKQAEQKLRLSELLSKAAFEQAAVGIVEIDLDTGQFTRVNNYFCELIGYSRLELEQVSVKEFTHPDDVAESRQHFQQLKKRVIDNFTLEKRYLRKDGSIFWSATTVSLINLPEGEGQRCLAIVKDISDRKQVEQRLEFTQFALNNFADHVLIMKMNGQIIDVNPAFCQSLEYSYAEINSLTLLDICPKAKESWETVSQAIKQNRSLCFESVHQKKYGELLPVEVSANYLEYAGEEYIVGIVRDITQRKAAQKSLSLAKFAVDNTAMVIFWLDYEGRFVNFNESACMYLDYDHSELNQLYLWDIAVDFPQSDWSSYWQEIKQSSFKRLEDKYQTKEGRVFPVEVTSNYIEYQGEGFIFAQAQDISDRKQAETELITQQNHLEALLNNIPHLAWIKNSENRFVAVNKAFAESSNSPASEIVGKTDFDFFPAELAQNYIQDDLQVLTSGKRKVVEEKIVRGDLTSGWIETTKTPFKNAQGDWAGTVGIAVDVTEYKDNQDKLYQSQQLLLLVLDTIPQLVCWKDRNSIYLGCNQAFADIAGLLSPEEIVGKTDRDLPWKQEEADFYVECDRRIMSSGQAELGIIETQLTAQGQETYIETNKSPLLDEQGKVIGILGSIQDVTLKKEAEKILKQTNEELEVRVLERTSALERANAEAELINKYEKTLNRIIKNIRQSSLVLDVPKPCL